MALVILFLASVARFYHPGTGFTALIAFPAGHAYEAPAMAGVPHYDYPAWASYDGEFYAQRALDPLLRDPGTDRAMDLPPFRARRILFSWTAFAAGLGRPVWIIEAYALQNVVCWLILAMLLTRWIPPTSGRGLALWAAILFSHGLLWSVRFALLDGPSLLLIACSVAAVERGHQWLSAGIVGIAGLGRETNLLALASQPWPRGLRDVARLAGVTLVAVLPVLIWYDYLRSIYRSTLSAGTGQLGPLGAAFASTLWQAVLSVKAHGVLSADGLTLGLLASLAVQAVYLLVRPRLSSPWWRVGIAYVLLLLILDPVLADPRTGAITRVLVPMTAGFNILLAGETRPTRFWLWFTAGNLHVLAGALVMPLGHLFF
jgi:hypothetical protein